MATSAETATPPGRRSLFGRLSEARLGSRLAVAIAIAAPFSGFLTYLVITDATPLGPQPELAVALIVLDVALLVLLAAIIGWRVFQLLMARRAGSAGSQLHIRLVTLFALIAVVPAILVAVFSAITINLGLETWFSTRVRQAVTNSVVVAEAYLDEHRQVIRADALAMATDVNRASNLLHDNPSRFGELVTTQAALRALPEAYVINSRGEIIAQASLAMAMTFDPPPAGAMDRAAEGEVVILTSEEDAQVRALVRLGAFVDAYLYVARFLDPRALDHLRRTRDAVEQYERLESQRSGVQLTLALIYFIFALLVLMTAIWVGLWFSNRLATPVGRLIDAAMRVSEGDLRVRVPEGQPKDEIGGLSNAFNRMTAQLQAQRDELVRANRSIDDRRRFIEAVLFGVSAGVVGLDQGGRVEVANTTACKLLGLPPDRLLGQRLEDVAPELKDLVRGVRKGLRTDLEPSDQVRIEREGTARELLVRVTTEPAPDGPAGFVVTLDDVTRLMAAQRMAAWADVARRIAHEIKNPLTPIQLSAERLKRKYSTQIGEGRAVFEQCTDTIVRQVGDIRHMVDEFSAFARMPKPVMAEENITEVVRQAVFLQQVGDPQIMFGVIAPDEAVLVQCDQRLISQALVNLLKNAGEAVHARAEQEGQGAGYEGKVRVEIVPGDGTVEVRIIDNGTGLPGDLRHRLTEPYVTTRDKGTGLGLAIVEKVMDDHGGTLRVSDAPDGRGASMTLVFPRPHPAGSINPSESVA
ncbi:sensor histidine kinase NtrY-like [Futiania mangrovi]|uniref:histidine kinase n=1 Tax=Futiania mangrovi TaxID=2959716 RepID=A0A9J6PDJ0_9PROT|nr:PAS domain-containing sensor histidine kinase [Futiania mangrovii]MCP1335779.1 PAS domain-containing sensor histidine kinase [Futiania mangrovii]